MHLILQLVVKSLSCGEDGTVRWFDLRTKQNCSLSDCKEDILINCRYAVTAIAVNHLAPYLLAVGCADSNVRIFDRRMLGTRALGNYSGNSVQSVVARFTVPDFEGKNHRITSLAYSPDGRDMLVSYSSDYVYLFDTRDNGKCNPKQLSTTPLSTTKKISEKPVMKRLRVRGDWSDTGPNARPEIERVSVPDRAITEEVLEEVRPSTRPVNLMQRMSDVLNRIFNTSGDSQAHTDNIDAIEENVINEATETSRESQSTTPVAGGSSCQLMPILKKPVDKDCDTSDRKSPKHVKVQQEPVVVVEYTPSCSSASGSETLSDSGLDDEGSTCSSDFSGKPATKTFSHSLHTLEKELVSRREEILSRSTREPVVNLQFSGQGVNNGLITVESGSVGSPSSPGSSLSSHATDRPESVMSDSLLMAESISPVPGYSRFLGSELDVNGNSAIIDLQPWQSEIDCDNEEGIHEDVLETTEDGVVEESDGRQSRRGNREDDDDEDETERSDATPVQHPPLQKVNGRNPRELLLRSFDDVLKHFREEREQEKQQLASINTPRIKQKYTGHRNARTMVSKYSIYTSAHII